MTKNQEPRTLSWAKFALCATVFLPGLSWASDAGSLPEAGIRLFTPIDIWDKDQITTLADLRRAVEVDGPDKAALLKCLTAPKNKGPLGEYISALDFSAWLIDAVKSLTRTKEKVKEDFFKLAFDALSQAKKWADQDGALALEAAKNLYLEHLNKEAPENSLGIPGFDGQTFTLLAIAVTELAPWLIELLAAPEQQSATGTLETADTIAKWFIPHVWERIKGSISGEDTRRFESALSVALSVAIEKQKAIACETREFSLYNPLIISQYLYSTTLRQYAEAATAAEIDGAASTAARKYAEDAAASTAAE